MNVEPTVQIMLRTANTMRDYADSLDRDAERLRKTGDWGAVSDGMGTISNMFNNLRLDLFVTRPLREFEREQTKWLRNEKA